MTSQITHHKSFLGERKKSLDLRLKQIILCIFTVREKGVANVVKIDSSSFVLSPSLYCKMVYLICNCIAE